jgi:hypothetical protein
VAVAIIGMEHGPAEPGELVGNGSDPKVHQAIRWRRIDPRAEVARPFLGHGAGTHARRHDRQVAAQARLAVRWN